MAEGIKIGSAYYAIEADHSGLDRGIQQAERTATAGTGRIGKSFSGLFSGITSGAASVVKGLGAFGLAVQGVQGVVDTVKGVGNALGVGVLNEMEQVRASLNAFTKDGARTEELMKGIREEANKTPFAFAEMAKATASLLPVAKASGAGIQDLVKQAEVLAASNPLEGLEGASFSLREAMTGDFTSIIERFNLSRSTINKLKAEGVPALEIVRRAMAEMGFDEDLIAAKAQTLEGRWSTFTDTLTTLQAKIGQPIFDALKESLVGLQGVLDDNMGTLEAFADTLAGGLKSGIEAAKAGFASLLDVWGSISEAFSQGGLVGALKAVGPMLGTLLENLGTLISDQVEAWAKSFAGWVDGADSELLSNLGDLAIGVLDFIQESAIKIYDKLGAWGAAFLDWIGPKIPPLLLELGKLLVKLTDWAINVALPRIAEALLKWGEAYLEWIAPRILPMLEEAGKLLLALTGWIITTALPAIVGKLAEWGAAFAAWVPGAVVSLLFELGKLEFELLAWIVKSVVQLNLKLALWGAAFLDWVGREVIPNLPVTLGKIALAILAWIVEKEVELALAAGKLGIGLITGIRDGIAGALGGFWSWLQTNFVDKIPTFVRDILGLQHDTGALAKVGERMVEELKTGIKNRWPTLEELFKRLGFGLAGSGGALLQQIGAIAAKIGGAEFARAAVAISASETGGGTLLSEVGGTGAKGPFQFDPGGELGNFARALGVSVAEAGKIAQSQPLLAAQWALTGYLGQAIRAGLERGLTGPALAVYGSRVGQRPRAGLEAAAGEWYQRLFSEGRGHDRGGLIRDPSLLVNARTGRPYGTMAERGPEYILGRRATASLGPAAPMLNRAGMGAWMAGVHPGATGTSSVVEGDVIFNGLTYDEAEARQKRRQHKNRLLAGVR